MKTISIKNQINFWRNARKEAIERNAPAEKPIESINKLDELIKQIKQLRESNREQKFKK
jgi:hypothetical protein